MHVLLFITMGSMYTENGDREETLNRSTDS